MTLQTLQQRSHDTMRQASREYIRQRIVQNAERHLKRAYVCERVTMRTAEQRRETDAEIRDAISGSGGNGNGNSVVRTAAGLPGSK